MKTSMRLLLVMVALISGCCGKSSPGNGSPPSGSAPEAPAGIAASAGNGQITISWQAVPGAVFYNLYWSNSSGISIATGARISGVTSPYQQAGLDNGTAYFYIVTAVNANGESAPSGTASATPTLAREIVSLATGAYPYSALAVDSTSVYWTTGDGIQKTGLNGGPVTTLASGLAQPSSPNGVTLDATKLYWTGAFLAGSLANIAVAAVPKDGGPIEILANAGPLAPSGFSPYSVGLVVDSGGVYWTEIIGHANGNIKKAGLGGGAITTMGNAGLPYFLAGDSDNVYWNDIGLGTINKLDKNGGPVVTLASGLAYPYSLAVDSMSVYWVETTTGSIRKVGLGGGAVTTLATGLGTGRMIAVDTANVFWTEQESGTVKKVGKNGGVATTLASGLNQPFGIAIDAFYVYWIEASGDIRKTAKSDGSLDP
jgi:hypothetical protein